MYKMIEILLIIGFALSYFIYTSIININYYFAIAILLFLIIMFMYLHSKKNIDKEKLKSYKMIIIPEVLLIVYSFIIVGFGDTSMFELRKFLSRALLYITTSFGAVAMYDLYGKKSLKILFYAMLLNYGFYIVMALLKEGISDILIYIKTALKGDSTASSILEAHEITFSFGLLFLYYYLIKSKEYKKYTIVCLLLFLLGFKRIGIVAIAIVLICNIFISRIQKTKNLKNIYRITGMVFLVASFFWIYMVKIDYFSIISQKYNINFMGRINLYSYVKNEYNLSLLFLGRGLGYINSFGILKGLHTSIHSCVLEMYIDVGTIAYIIYCYNKFVLNSNRILLQKNSKKANMYFLLMIYIFILWFSDNVAIYLNFMFASNIIFLNIINNFEEEKSLERESNEYKVS